MGSVTTPDGDKRAVGDGGLSEHIEERARGAIAEVLASPVAQLEVSVPHPMPEPVKIIYPLARHSLESVRAAIILIDNGLRFVARGNARVAFECAVTSEWVALTKDGEHEIAQEMRRQEQTTIRHYSKMNLPLPADLAEELQAKYNAAPQAQRFMEMCSRFSPNESRQMYLMYRQASDAIHPSAGIVREHPSVRG